MSRSPTKSEEKFTSKNQQKLDAYLKSQFDVIFRVKSLISFQVLR